MVLAVEAGEEDDLVLFAAGRAVFVGAGPPPVEIGLDVGAPDTLAGRTAKDDGGDGWAVGFTRARNAEVGSAENFHFDPWAEGSGVRLLAARCVLVGGALSRRRAMLWSIAQTVGRTRIRRRAQRVPMESVRWLWRRR